MRRMKAIMSNTGMQRIAMRRRRQGRFFAGSILTSALHLMRDGAEKTDGPRVRYHRERGRETTRRSIIIRGGSGAEDCQLHRGGNKDRLFDISSSHNDEATTSMPAQHSFVHMCDFELNGSVICV